MLDFLSSHSIELASAASAIIFMLVLGFISIEDALKHRAD